MTKKKKRKADRVYENDPEGEALLPVRKTKEIAETHSKTKTTKENKKFPPAMEQLGTKEDGKELFDFVLKGLSSPDKK
jgi:hypothetical protein